MFQLIVAVIAIALVIALTLASIFYGGEAFTRSSLKANVAAMVNQAQQISGAHTLYKVDNAKDAVDVDALEADGYLADVPTPPQIADTAWALSFADADFGGDDVVKVTISGETDEICEEVANNGAGSCNVAEDAYAFPL